MTMALSKDLFSLVKFVIRIFVGSHSCLPAGRRYSTA